MLPFCKPIFNNKKQLGRSPTAVGGPLWINKQTVKWYYDKNKNVQ